MKRINQFFALLVFLLVLSLTACVHEPLFTDDMGPISPIDTMMVDTTMNPSDSMPCDPTRVYFNTEVLPLLKANCAQSGCHDQVSQQDGVILNSYENIMASNVVKPFDADGSDLYEVLRETDLDKRMPPPPANSLTIDQIALIETWITQGADNLICDDTVQSGCVTTAMSYASNIVAMINTNCRSCHSGTVPAGGIDLTSHASVRVVALNGKLVGALDHRTGFSPMPQGGTKLDPCMISQVEAWVVDGALNN